MRTVAIALALAAATPSRAAEFHFHGLLDVVASGRGPAYDYNRLTRGDSPFDAYSLRVFADASVNDQLSIFSQCVLRDATTPYVDGAYLSYRPSLGRDVNVVAGKIPWPIGTFAPRTYSNKNPLIGSPLMYQYHSSLVWYQIPPTADALLSSAGKGQFGVNYEGYDMGPGMPLVDDSYWDVGVTLLGSERPVEYAVGIVAGTPGWGSTSRDENSGKTVLGRLGLAPLPALRVGVSGAYGPYLDQGVAAEIPAGRDVTDYHQKLMMADVELLLGHAELRAEGAHNVWESPTVGDLEVRSGYVEGKYSLPFGTFVAGRWDALRFGEIADSTGVQRPWDWNVTRIETGVGYRFNRDAQAKLVYQRNRIETDAAAEVYQTHSLVGLQVSVSF
jgi:hypothetical protein